MSTHNTRQAETAREYADKKAKALAMTDGEFLKWVGDDRRLQHKHGSREDKTAACHRVPHDDLDKFLEANLGSFDRAELFDLAWCVSRDTRIGRNNDDHSECERRLRKSAEGDGEVGYQARERALIQLNRAFDFLTRGVDGVKVSEDTLTKFVQSMSATNATVRGGKSMLETFVDLYDMRTVEMPVREMIKAIQRAQEQGGAEGKKGSTVPETPVKGRSVSPSGPAKADGTPDMRYAANKSAASSSAPAASPGPAKADGTPDMRYAANKSAASSSAPAASPGPAKADGTPDMRYAANKSAASSSAPAVSPGPAKADGTPDMRYAANKSASSSYSSTPSRPSSSYSSGPTKADGTPDMRYAANKSASSSYSSTPSYSSSSYSSSSYSSGPTKADGTPDMRYSCNRK
jgi:hypothetical protein